MAAAQLVETQKSLRMLNSGTKQLDHLLSIERVIDVALDTKGNLLKLKVFLYQ